MSESDVENLEKALGPCLIMRGGLTSLSLWKVDRYPGSLPHLDRIPYCDSLPKENPKVYLATRQEY